MSEQLNSAKQRYPNALAAFRIGNVALKNRIFIPAHTTNFAVDFLPTDRHVHYQRERAKGGAGLIFIEPLRVHRTSLGRFGGLFGNDPRALPGLRKITDAIHEEGIPAFVQINHTGRHGDNYTERLPAWGPSSIPWTTSGIIPHVMSRAEIGEITAAFAETAQAALEAGFDGMEVHFGHGHLLHQFLSPASNDRSDEYGGSFENRLRFPMEVLRAVFDKVGDKAPVGVRLSLDELVPGGLDAEASREIANRVSIEPGVSFINASVSSYTWPSVGYHVADMSYPPHPYLDLTVALRDAIGDTPLLTANRYRTVAEAEEALATGAIDMVGIMRAHVADPELVNKAVAGKEDEVRPCIASNFCVETLAVHRPLTCMMNPRVGHEGTWPAEPESTDTPLRVLVIGGGPAGMEAARLASSRGHDVTLWERESELGGALNLAGTGVGRADLHRMKQYLEEQVRRSKADILLGHNANAESIVSHGADVVILATGAVPANPELEGCQHMFSAEEALAVDRELWRNSFVCIYDMAGSWATLSVAETIAASGAKVTLLSKPETVLWDINIYSRMTAMDRLKDLGVSVLARVEPVRVANGTIVIRETSLGRETVIGEFTHFVGSIRGQSNLTLYDDLQKKGVNVRSVGDASAPASLLQAMYDGNSVGRAL